MTQAELAEALCVIVLEIMKAERIQKEYLEEEDYSIVVDAVYQEENPSVVRVTFDNLAYQEWNSTAKRSAEVIEFSAELEQCVPNPSRFMDEKMRKNYGV